MPTKVICRTGVTGGTASSRRLLAGVSAATAAPTLKGDGVLLQRNEFIHLFFDLTSTDASAYFTLQLWWYTPISGKWHIGESFTVNSDSLSTFEVQGLDRVYAQVTSVSATDTPTLDAWVGLVVPV